MKIGYISDIHLEQYRKIDDAIKFLEYIRPIETLDVLILAGDIWSLNSLSIFKYLDEFKKWAVELIFVPGNHCYYNINPVFTAKEMLDKLQLEGLRVLGPEFQEAFTYNDIKFVGSTLWYPDNPTVRQRVMNWSDKGCIKNFIPWWQEQQAAERKLLWKETEKDCIVVTHMLPTWSCVADKFIGDLYNCLFVADVEDIILEKQPKYWICGHSHHKINLIVGNTQILSNPIGYFHERLSEISVLKLDF